MTYSLPKPAPSRTESFSSSPEEINALSMLIKLDGNDDKIIEKSILLAKLGRVERDQGIPAGTYDDRVIFDKSTLAQWLVDNFSINQDTANNLLRDYTVEEIMISDICRQQTGCIVTGNKIQISR